MSRILLLVAELQVLNAEDLGLRKGAKEFGVTEYVHRSHNINWADYNNV